MKNKRLLLMALLVICGLNLAPVAASAEEIAHCKENVRLLNYRSDLLGVYKKNEDRSYNKVRKLWAERIAYAGRWVEKDAEKARDALYQYDALHAATMKEVDKQIKAYEPLKQNPLDCDKTDPSILKAKIGELNGRKNKKAVSGHALLTSIQKQEAAYVKGDFKKQTETMIDKLHKAKRGQAQAPNVELKVKQL